MSDQANRITAEYLLRKVPTDWQAHEDDADMARGEYVSPIRFICGWVVVLAVFGLIWIGV